LTFLESFGECNARRAGRDSDSGRRWHRWRRAGTRRAAAALVRRGKVRHACADESARVADRVNWFEFLDELDLEDRLRVRLFSWAAGFLLALGWWIFIDAVRAF